MSNLSFINRLQFLDKDTQDLYKVFQCAVDTANQEVMEAIQFIDQQEDGPVTMRYQMQDVKKAIDELDEITYRIYLNIFRALSITTQITMNERI